MRNEWVTLEKLAAYFCGDKEEKFILPWQAQEMVLFSDFAQGLQTTLPQIGNNGYYFPHVAETYILVTFQGDVHPAGASDL